MDASLDAAGLVARLRGTFERAAPATSPGGANSLRRCDACASRAKAG